MATGMGNVGRAMGKVFSDWRHVLVAMIAAAGMFGVLIFLPAGRVSATVFYYQVTGLDAASLAAMGFFSIVLGLLVSTNVYLLRIRHVAKKNVGIRGIISMVSSFFAGIFGSAVCLACLSILLGFLGVPAITFLVAYRKGFFLVSAAIALISLYVSCRAVVEHDVCGTCNVRIRPRT